MWSSAVGAHLLQGFNKLCIQRWFSAYLGSNEWLFELPLPFYHLEPVTEPGHSFLASTMHFRPENFSLDSSPDIFSFPDHSGKTPEMVH